MQVRRAERVIRMRVHREALTGIEQLDQQHRRGAERRDVLGTQPGQRGRRDGVGEQSSIAKAAGPEAPFTGEPGELVYFDFGKYLLVQADRNGDGLADFAIKVFGASTLTANDFVL